MPTRHVARTTADVEVTFTCDACGYSANARVEAAGTGSAASFVFLDRHHARDKAADEALEEAQYNARTIATIAPCPRCHRRSRAAVSSFIVRGALEMTIGIALLVAFAWFPGGWMGWVVGALCVAGALGSLQRRRVRYRLAGMLLRDVRPNVVLPRAQVRSLPAAQVPARTAAVEPPRIPQTPASEEPGTLR